MVPWEPPNSTPHTGVLPRPQEAAWNLHSPRDLEVPAPSLERGVP